MARSLLRHDVLSPSAASHLAPSSAFGPALPKVWKQLYVLDTARLESELQRKSTIQVAADQIIQNQTDPSSRFFSLSLRPPSVCHVTPVRTSENLLYQSASQLRSFLCDSSVTRYFGLVSRCSTEGCLSRGLKIP